MYLDKFKKNVYSQYGEDGIIEQILKDIGDNDSWCVEFGAWDGIYLSNTYNLVNHYDYNAVMIEGSFNRYEDLLKLKVKHENILPINAFVDVAENSLDNLLSKTNIPNNFDILSIDIDGNDYYIFESLQNYKPKIVVIEYNPTIPNEVDYVQNYNFNITRGASISKLIKLGKEKGYIAIATTTTNIIFVDKIYSNLYNFDNSINNIRTDYSKITYIFFGYDGKVLLDGYKKLPWHGIEIKEYYFEILPKFLRIYSGNMTKLEKIIMRNFMRLKQLFK